MRYRDKWPEYAKQCDTMAIKPERVAEFERMARYAIANKAIYQQVEAATASHYPWYAIAATHKRESDAQDEHGNPLFTSYLGNGQPLWVRTTIVPENRGPFITQHDALTDPQKCIAAFVAGSLDALHLEKIDAVVPPWPLEKLLFWEEILNGTGYDGRGLPSPYIFGGTSIQRPGKYIRDHVFDDNVMDTQLGVAGMFWMIAHLDVSVHFTRET
jgi:lysozyme family protein